MTQISDGSEGVERRQLSRRKFLAASGLAAAGLTFGPNTVRSALATTVRGGESPYGSLQPPDSNGIALPEGFSSRVVARGGRPVIGTNYKLPRFPDGQATFQTRDEGWILVTNSETLASAGAGTSAIRFNPEGKIVDAYRILGGTSVNCAGGPTPWGTWLSGEETGGGMIWECDPFGKLQPEPRPLLGVFSHEAAAVDPVEERIYLTEDDGAGCFYRFTPSLYPALEEGVLEAAIVDDDGMVRWEEVPDPTTAETGTATQNQVSEAKRFDGSEGIWYARGVCYFTTKGDVKVWSYDIGESRLEVLYDREVATGSSLDAVDNVTVNAFGDVFVCEDGGNMEIGIISEELTVSPMVRLPGSEHQFSELCGVCFDPSGKKMYFTSQRAAPSGSKPGLGTVFEVSGPFRLPDGFQPPDFIYGPPAGEVRPRGRLNPGPRPIFPRVEVTAPKAIGDGSLRELGLPVTVEADDEAQVAITLTTLDLERDEGSDGSSDRPVLTDLARQSLDLVPDDRGGGKRQLALELDQESQKLVRERFRGRAGAATLRLTMAAVNPEGRRVAKLIRVKLEPSRSLSA